MAVATGFSPTHGSSGDTLRLHRRATSGEVSIPPLQPNCPAIPPNAKNGTALAINYLSLGVAPDLPRSTRRGGARNRADRESHALTLAQIANLKAATRHAGAIGLPFTRMVTIHWKAAGVPLSAMAKATGRFLDLLTRWLARRDCRTAWLWVHENGHGKGWHCHFLVHVPAAFVPKLQGPQKRWLRSITGLPYVAGVIVSKPIAARLGVEVGNPELHRVNLQVALGYHCKGAPQSALDAIGIDRTHEPGGRVIGKRCGTSQNIGATARRQRG